jgi:hypothetical protein
MLRKIPEEIGSHLQRGGSLKSRKEDLRGHLTDSLEEVERTART